jgi:hypothetical protein
MLYKHYQYRSPQQIQKRLDTRRDNRARGFPGWEHAKELSWKEKIVRVDTCHVDLGNGIYEIDWQKLPKHIEPPHVRFLKMLLHGMNVWP